jgi:hypothetical protein
LENLCIGIEIGAGLGVKMGLFADPQHQIEDELLRRNEYADDFEGFVVALLSRLDLLLKKRGWRMRDVRAIGIASPGLFRSDGTYQLAANLRFLRVWQPWQRRPSHLRKRRRAPGRPKDRPRGQIVDLARGNRTLACKECERVPRRPKYRPWRRSAPGVGESGCISGAI